MSRAIIDVQEKKTALVKCVYTDDNNTVSVDVPANSFVKVRGYVATANNDTGTATVTVSDGTTTFINAQNIKTVGALTVAVSDKFVTADTTITATITAANGNSTAGVFYLEIEYSNVLESSGSYSING